MAGGAGSEGAAAVMPDKTKSAAASLIRESVVIFGVAEQGDGFRSLTLT